MAKQRPLNFKNLMLVLIPSCLVIFLICYLLGNSYGFFTSAVSFLDPPFYKTTKSFSSKAMGLSHRFPLFTRRAARG